MDARRRRWIPAILAGLGVALAAPSADGPLEFHGTRILPAAGPETYYGTSIPEFPPVVAGNGVAALYSDGETTLVSADGGATFSAPGPGLTATTSSTWGGSPIYLPSIDTFVLGTLRGPDGLRLAFADTAGVRSDAWSFLDVPGLGRWPPVGVSGVVLSRGTNALYATVQLSYDDLGAFLSSDGFEVLRFPLSDFTGGGPATWDRWTALPWGVRPLPVRDCGTEYFAAGLSSDDALVVFHVPEGSDQMEMAVVPLGASERVVEGSPDPSGSGFLHDRYDSLVEAATLAGGDLWFAWTAGSGGRLSLPRPYVEVARIRASDFALLDQQAVASPAFDVGYPSLAAGADGEVAVAFHAGGGSLYSSLGVGFLTGTRTIELAVTGERSHTPGPTDLSPDPAGGTGFVAAGAVRAEGAGGYGARVRLVEFGRGPYPVERVSISGYVTGADFRPLPAVTVSAGFGSTEVAGGRRYEISGLQPGPRRVVPHAEGYGFLPPYRLAFTGPGPLNLDFTAERRTLGLWTSAGSIRVDRSGVPAIRIRGTVGFSDPNGVEEFDPHGQGFDVAVVAGNAVYQRDFRAWGSSWRTRGSRYVWRVGREELVLRPAPDGEHGLFRFSLRARASVRGSRWDPAGHPVGISLRWGNALGTETMEWETPADQVLRR